MENLMSSLNNTTVLVSGATGLIGFAVVKALLQGTNRTTVYALVRNREKAERMFQDFNHDQLRILTSDITALKEENLGIEYIIHSASQTSSKSFVEQPVETIETAIRGTEAILRFARVNPVKSFVYLSSMEVYGTPQTDEIITEEHSTNLDTMSVRSCYPESKRMCENLCVSYLAEYGVPVRILRLTQTFGAGVSYHDGRVFAEFARCAIEGRDIVLKTKGKTRRCYLALNDAVDAILTVLIKGENGNAYNAANEKTYCSIYELAQLVCDTCADQRIKVIIDEPKDVAQFGYAPVLRMNLSAAKLNTLGWRAQYGLEDMFREMIQEMKKEYQGA